MSSATGVLWTERLADLSDDELLALGLELQTQFAEVARKFRSVESATLQRMDAAQAVMLHKGAFVADRTVTRETQWDVALVAEYAKDHVVFIEPKPTIGHYEVRNTNALNALIKKLGDTEEGRALAAARTIVEKNPRVKFRTVDTDTGEVT